MLWGYEKKDGKGYNVSMQVLLVEAVSVRITMMMGSDETGKDEKEGGCVGPALDGNT